MATLTINVNPETLERAEKKAAEQGTSVDQVVGTYLVSVRREQRQCRAEWGPSLRCQQRRR